MITKREIQYEGFGRCLEIANGTVRILVTLDFGPRIIRYSFLDGENVMFEDKERAFFSKGEEMDRAFGKDSVWYIYGGHRLWTSPEAFPRSYYPDNDPVSVRLTEKGAVFTPPVQRWNQYSYETEVSLDENTSDVTVQHRITNKAAWDVTLALWALSVLAPGGMEIVPQPLRDAGMLANRQMAFWTYSKMTDPRFKLLNRYIILKQDRNVKDNFKLGIGSEHGYAMYFNHGDVFIKRFEAKENGNYPDGGMSFETYTNPLFLEMESLGELKTLLPGESAEHTERWSLMKAEPPEADDDAIDAAIKRILDQRF